MILEDTVYILDLDIHVTYGYSPEEPCRPEKYDPGSPEEFELLSAFIDQGVTIYLDITCSHNKEILTEAIKKSREMDKAA